jgi:predicted nucleotidyltransferase
VPEQIENEPAQEAYWELEKGIVLALKANPNVLETLSSPLIETVRPPADELLGERHRFVSRLVYQTYNGYVLSQFKKLQADLRTTGSVRWKHVMHLLRLLLAGTVILREGRVPLDVGAARDRLLAVRRGELDWPEVELWRRDLHRELDAAYRSTVLPERPDYAWADDFLVRARRSMVAR